MKCYNVSVHLINYYPNNWWPFGAIISLKFQRYLSGRCGSTRHCGSSDSSCPTCCDPCRSCDSTGDPCGPSDPCESCCSGSYCNPNYRCWKYQRNYTSIVPLPLREKGTIKLKFNGWKLYDFKAWNAILSGRKAAKSPGTPLTTIAGAKQKKSSADTKEETVQKCRKQNFSEHWKIGGVGVAREVD